MAFNRSRGTRVVRVPPKRLMIWAANRLGALAVAGSAKTVVLSLNAGALASRPFTIVRTRIQGLFQSDQSAASELTSGALGAVVVSEQAQAIGATAVPGPVSDPDADWFVYHGLTSDYILQTGVGFERDSGHHFTIDSKAMRKVDENKTAVFVMELATAAGALLALEGRFLIKLH